eukprot:TCONS_00011901-protein
MLKLIELISFLLKILLILVIFYFLNDTYSLRSIYINQVFKIIRNIMKKKKRFELDGRRLQKLLPKNYAGSSFDRKLWTEISKRYFNISKINPTKVKCLYYKYKKWSATEAKIFETNDDGGKLDENKQRKNGERFEDEEQTSDDEQRKKGDCSDDERFEDGEQTSDDGGRLDENKQRKNDERFEDEEQTSDDEQRKKGDCSDDERFEDEEQTSDDEQRKKGDCSDDERFEDGEQTSDDGGRVDKNKQRKNGERFEDGEQTSDDGGRLDENKQRKNGERFEDGEQTSDDEQRKKGDCSDDERFEDGEQTSDDGGRLDENKQRKNGERFEDGEQTSDDEQRKKGDCSDDERFEDGEQTSDDGGRLDENKQRKNGERFEDGEQTSDDGGRLDENKQRKNGERFEDGEQTSDDGGRLDENKQRKNGERFEDGEQTSDDEQRKKGDCSDDERFEDGEQTSDDGGRLDENKQRKNGERFEDEEQTSDDECGKKEDRSDDERFEDGERMSVDGGRLDESEQRKNGERFEDEEQTSDDECGKKEDRSGERSLTSVNLNEENAYADFLGKVMFSYAKCAVGQHGQTPQNLSIPKLLNKNSNNNDDRLLKELAESEDITPKDFYRKISPKNLKIDIPDGLNTLKINRGSKENKFAAGYTNYFADVLLKLNNCCSFKFVYNFVKKKDSRKKISPLFTVKAKCAMEGCPVKVTIQRYENSKGPDEFLKVRFSGDIKHRRGDLKARKLSHKKKSELEDYFKQSKSKPSIAYRDKLASMDPLQFASGNRDGLGVGLKSFQNIASKVHKERDELNNMNNNICALQKRFVDEDKERDVLKKKKVYGYIHYPSLSDSGISLTMTDEGLVRYYHKVAPLDVLFFDASGSFVSGVPWLKNKKNKKKRILLYALMARLPSGKCPPLPLLEYISSEHNVFSIRQAFSRLREVENRIYGSGNAVSPKLIIIDYSAAMVQAVLQEFTGSTLEEYLERTYRIIHGNVEKRKIVVVKGV